MAAEYSFPTEAKSRGGHYLAADPFFPEIDLRDMRLALRIDNTVTAERLQFVALSAIDHVNRQLRQWQEQAAKTGARSMAQVNRNQQINGDSIDEARYRRAVYAYAKVQLLEAYADYDASGKTASRAEAKQEQANDYRREAHAAIADIKGVCRQDAELL